MTVVHVDDEGHAERGDRAAKRGVPSVPFYLRDAELRERPKNAQFDAIGHASHWGFDRLQSVCP